MDRSKIEIFSNKKNLVPITAILALIAGYFIGFSIEKNNVKNIEARLTGEIFSNVFPVNNITGKIIAINSDKNILFVKVDNIYGVNIPKNYQEKQILIDSQTKIILRQNKDVVAINKELIEKKISTDELKVGDVINFSPLRQQQNENILSPLFVAVQINVSR